MASAFRRIPRDLIEELEQDAPRFKFFQAVRLLALTARHYGGRRRALLPKGLRFRTIASLSFPASELVQYRTVESEVAGTKSTRDEMTVAFLGLTGPSGTLPTPYTEMLINRRQRYRDVGLHAFLDMFSHRAVALFYGAWRKYRYWLDVEDGQKENLTGALLDLAGVGFPSLRDKLGTGDAALVNENFFLFYAGLLSQKPVSAMAMGSMIRGFYGVPVEVEQFVGQWINVPLEEQSHFGGKACVLGLSAFAGERIWDRQTKIRIRMGPMRIKQFEQLLPGEPGAKALETLVRFVVGFELACDVVLTLDRRDVPELKLGPDQRLLLGGNTWLNTSPPERDPDEMRYRLLR